MAILIDASTRVICQGIPSDLAAQHARECHYYGTRIVGGVTAGKGGTHFDIEAVATGGGFDGKAPGRAARIPVFNSMFDAVHQTGADATMIFVPPPLAADAIVEAADAGVRLIVCITQGIPVLDMVKAVQALKRFPESRLIGPNCMGVLTPESCKVGTIPGSICRAGDIGVVSRAGALTCEVIRSLTQSGLGQSTCVDIGGDPVRGAGYIEMLELFERDPATKGVVLLGGIGGSDEEDAAEWIGTRMTKPVVAFVNGSAGAVESKVQALRSAGVTVCDSAAEIGATALKAMAKQKGSK